MRGATWVSVLLSPYSKISIHAPHAGSDFAPHRLPEGLLDFNPRSPCGERHVVLGSRHVHGRFQSTLPMRGATRKLYDYYRRRFISIHAPHAGSDGGVDAVCGVVRDFNPRSPCGERRSGFSFSLQVSPISIHAPHAGSDHGCFDVRAAPVVISIHAPHAGSDRFHSMDVPKGWHFNPRSPCGERPIFSCGNVTPSDFNPRSPCGERPFIPVFHDPLLISIHAPHAGSDGKGTKRKSPHL